MSDVVKIRMGSEKAESIDLFGEFNEQIEQMCKDFPDVERKALNVGAHILRESIKSSIISRWAAAGKPFKVKTPKTAGAKTPYITRSTPIADGTVRQSRVRNGVATVSITGGEPNTASYLAKMHDNGSKTRYMKKRLGKPLRPSKSLGFLKGLHYFEPGVLAGENECFEAISRVVFKKLEEIYEQ